MRLRLLELVRCPACGDRLRLGDGTRPAEPIETGTLACAGGCPPYPIVRGVPRLLAGPLAEEKRRTADAFGWEWTEFSTLHDADRTREQFLDWIAPIEPGFFRDKVVLDAGCGMGRFAVESARFGARDVIAVDLSDAVEAAAANARGHASVHVVQADIYRLPLARRADGDTPVDFAYSIGVLHHLPDPERGFAAVASHVRPGGAMFAWVYGRENNGWLVHVVNPIRERVSSRLPRGVLYAASLGLTALLTPALKLAYRPTARAAWLAPLNRRLPYRAYLNWLAGYGFRHNHHVVFDHLVAPTSFYIRRDELAGWFARAGLDRVRISWRNENSWRGFGEVPAAGAAAATA